MNLDDLETALSLKKRRLTLINNAEGFLSSRVLELSFLGVAGLTIRSVRSDRDPQCAKLFCDFWRATRDYFQHDIAKIEAELTALGAEFVPTQLPLTVEETSRE